MKVYLIRHAQSENNTLKAELRNEARRRLGTETLAWKTEADNLYIPRRSADPLLTKKGRYEAAELGRSLAHKLRNEGKRAVIYSSPMQRTILTATPLALALGTTITIRGDLHEVYGVYKSAVSPNGKLVHSNPGSLTRDELRQQHKVIGDVSHLRPSGGWYNGERETLSEAADRACQVARWIQSPELLSQIRTDEVLVIYSHGHFLDKLIKALMGGRDLAGHDPVFFHIANTSIIELTVEEGEGKSNCSIKLDNLPHLQGGNSAVGPKKISESVWKAGVARRNIVMVMSAALLGLVGSYVLGGPRK
mmetsp:Transcript_9666/g.23793  ORF Transcript_9666/g.23793 Transcript_9666/m.23793 type:complete len:306 (-) Transcript_9666:106-1023(-)|eukprot:CAMPEP_0114511158 /NCGR_PEP_ID=MMETSP0109-20121206/14198_1 /TAXON_ID=29199 /ORGANISM="Chlorarachnion reptans, Strain CCCM449" /LENGTH=305 /DNA_ID=CAMNT_0001690567 /DNA_START=100 /DNA_END=1017 /DNA_ORIENTATION=+